MNHEEMIASLEATDQYRVLRRFAAPEAYQQVLPEQGRVRVVMVVDVETTGLNKDADKVIDFGYVLAQFDRTTGAVLRVIERYSGFEDPGMPIPEEITRLTGIRDSDVAGQRLDDSRVEAAIAKADLVVAHNAPFDRGFLEMRYPSFERKWWACSQREAPWVQMQTGSTKLEWLAFRIAGVYYGAHRALVDAEVLLHLLAQRGPDERSVLSHLLESSGRKTYCVWAVNSPFEAKDRLKLEMGYSWNDGSSPDKPIKAWFKQGVTDLDAELAKLANIYPGTAMVTVDCLTGFERFTARYRSREQHSVGGTQAPSVATASPQAPQRSVAHGLPI